jgi:hypothetical protein
MAGNQNLVCYANSSLVSHVSNSVEQDPWELGGWSGDQNFPLVLMDANVFYVAHMIPHTNLPWASLIQSIFSHFISDEFNSIHPFTLRSDKWFFLESSSTKIFNAILGCLLTQTPHQVHLPWFNHSGGFWLTVDTNLTTHAITFFFLHSGSPPPPSLIPLLQTGVLIVGWDQHCSFIILV